MMWSVFHITSPLYGNPSVTDVFSIAMGLMPDTQHYRWRMRRERRERFPRHRRVAIPTSRSFGVFFDLRLNKRLSKQSWGW